MSELNNKIKTVFGMAALEHEAAKKMTPDEWQQYRKVNEQFDQKLAVEKRQYDLHYKTRVDEVRRRLINKAGAKDKNFVNKIFGRDAFDKSTIDRRAQIIVRNELQSAVDQIETNRFTALEKLADSSAYRREQREKSRKDFQRATDRRIGPDRRQRER